MTIDEDIDRDPVTLALLRTPPSVLIASPEPVLLGNIQENPPVPSRREYVWRTIDRGQQCIATVAPRIGLDLDIISLASALNRLACTDVQNPHRCAGYIREEITLTTNTVDSVGGKCGQRCSCP